MNNIIIIIALKIQILSPGIVAPRSGSQFRQAEQTLDVGVDVEVSSESVGPDEKCVNKVMMVEETEYTEEVTMMFDS